MIKIAYIIDTIVTPNAGTEKQLLLLLDAIDKNKFQPFLIVLRESEFIKNNTLPVPVIVFRMQSLKSPKFWIEFFRLIRLLKKEKFSIAQTFFRDGNIFGTIAAKLARIPVIISSRRNIGYWHNQLEIKILQFLSGMTDYYIANSEAVKQLTVEREQVSPSKIHVIYNGLKEVNYQIVEEESKKISENLKEFLDGKIVVGIVSNLRPVKNIEFFLESAADLIKKVPEMCFIVIGDGPLKKDLEKKVQELGIGQHVYFAGSQSNIYAWIRVFDIAVMCSKSESFSNALIEYMFMGKPIVASDVGGNTEAIADGFNGVIYKEGDKKEFVNAVLDLAKKPEKAEKLGVRAQKTAEEKYTLKHSVYKHEQFYEKVIKHEGIYEENS
jgi:glycosyltransferase involved in cell wall biosynthesis